MVQNSKKSQLCKEKIVLKSLKNHIRSNQPSISVNGIILYTGRP